MIKENFISLEFYVKEDLKHILSNTCRCRLTRVSMFECVYVSQLGQKQEKKLVSKYIKYRFDITSFPIIFLEYIIKDIVIKNIYRNH